MIVLLAGCSPLGKTFVIDAVEPGSSGVFVELRTVVWVPEDASDTAVGLTLRADPAPDSLEALDRFAEIRTLYPGTRVYRLEIDAEDGLRSPIWIGRWDDAAVRKGVAGTLFTAVRTDDGWSAQGHFDAPWIEDVEPVLLHDDRAWFPTTAAVLVHTTAGTLSE